MCNLKWSNRLPLQVHASITFLSCSATPAVPNQHPCVTCTPSGNQSGNCIIPWTNGSMTCKSVFIPSSYHVYPNNCWCNWDETSITLRQTKIVIAKQKIFAAKCMKKKPTAHAIIHEFKFIQELEYTNAILKHQKVHYNSRWPDKIVICE